MPLHPQEPLDSEAEELHRQLDDLSARLRAMQERAESLRGMQAERGELVASFLHDLRSPLTALLLGARLISRDPGLSEVNRRVARDLIEAAGVIQESVRDLWDLTLAERGELPMQAEVLELTEVADAAQRSVSTAVAEKRLRVRALLEPVLVRADRSLCGRVVQRLLAEAVHQAASDSAITLQIGPEPGGSGARVHVRNCEPSARAADAPGHGAGAGAAHGTDEEDLLAGRKPDVGLLFCRAALERQGGRAWSKPCPAGGSNFYGWLPPAGDPS